MNYCAIFFFRVSRYLRYIIFSRQRKGHGIHSPFVFNLITHVFRNKIDTDIVFSIEMMRMKMISDKRFIEINDLGAGSTMMKTNNRRVSDIVRNSSVSKKYGILLSNLASEFGQPYILELGTSLGISTLYMAKSSSEVKVRSIEGCTSTSAIAGEYFRCSNVSNIDLLTGSFDDMLPTVLGNGKKPGLVFIDGDHRKDNILRYFRLITESSDENTVIVIDDIYYSKEMELAWKEIKQSDKVTFTVDLFRMGIVFFRKGMTRNDYIIRY